MHLAERLPPPPGNHAFAAFSAAAALAGLLIMQFDFVPILDHVNLAFHEAGHLFFGLLGEVMHWLGGTLGQFVFPIACLIHFLRREQLLQAAACALWGCENLHYVAAYVADARAQQLPLVGGGEHDWAWLLGRWGLLESDQRIAGVLVFLCWSGWLAVWAGVAWWWWQGRAQREAREAMQRRERAIAVAREAAARRARGEG
jgi:hypothetical protein